MSKNTAGLFHEPPPEEIHLYEYRTDGKWYVKDEIVKEVERQTCGTPLVYTPSKMASTPVGDLSSDERGSAARALGDDKYQAELIPVGLWCEYVRGRVNDNLYRSMSALANFQEGDNYIDLGPTRCGWWKDAARVFDYGRHKYAEWNWLKGQKWSVPIGCAIRHAVAIADGEEMDPESGLPHIGHYMCNLIMLATFIDCYPEGDDRPDPKYFG